MEGNIRLIETDGIKHQMAMEKWFGHDFLGAKVKEDVRPTSLSF